jgi:acyl-CoA synthetase (AMP-forming)/AMP-acid ligase II
MTIFESTQPPIPDTGETVTQLLFFGLTHRPDTVVLTDGPTGRTMTAGHLMTQIKSLAGGLQARGLGQGARIALMAPNMPEYCVVFHAVAWAGGTITTINPTYTPHEIRHQLIDSGAEYLITVTAVADNAAEAIKGTDVTGIALIDGAKGGDYVALSDLMGPEQPDQSPVDAATHIVVLPYSSGTTGLPKGVMLTHRNLVMNVKQCLSLTPIAPNETTVAFLPFFHIYGMTVMMNLFLSAGGGLVTLPRFDLEMFLRLCQDHKVHQIYVVPPVALALAKHPMVDQFDLSNMSIMLSGAAPLGGEIADAVGARLGLRAIQGYGMTEMAPVSHLSPHDGTDRAGSSGILAPNTRCKVINAETGAPLPPGEEGELLVKGPQVMTGYLNNDAATAASLDADGWLHTGDLASVDADGFMYIHDRVKELIKVNGFQVAPAELEAHLLTNPAIADAAVIGVPDDAAGERPIAFVVKTADDAIDAEGVKAHVADALSSYKHLTDVTFTDAIPKSASGKILRRLLRDQI